VTGGNQGIGKGIAIALAKAAADVLIQYHSAKDKAGDGKCIVSVV
jgi:NAD(P)-dependent dehydrogenase (short-subunit alcohol dehydrogenase family)